VTTVLLAVGRGGALLAVALVVIVIAKLAIARALRFDVDAALFEQDNPAVALAAGGYYAGVAAVLWAALTGVEPTFVLELLSTAVYGMVGVALLALAVRLAAPVLLPRLDVHAELVRDRNAGTGVVVGAAALASGLIAAGAISGNAPGGFAGGIASAAATFVVGQCSLALLTRLYGRVVGFDAHAEILADNTAAGCALAGALLANGILLGWGVSGDLDPARPLRTLAPLGTAVGAAVVLMPVTRLLVSRLFFAGVPFEAEIRRDRNVAAGIVDMLVQVLAALLVVRLLA
jgi:uncharacterized membrane protein YjfL (UPF0719 family)